MATSLATDFKVYNEFFYSGITEAIAQNLNVFNASSNGSIMLGSERKLGNYFYESFFKQAAAVTRRDNTSLSDATAVKLTQGEFISVKCLGKFLQESALDAIKKIMKSGASAQELSFLMGKQYAEQKIDYMLSFAIGGGVAGIIGQATNVYDNTGETTATLTHNALVKGMSKLGDAGQTISAWVMHSKPFYDLVGQSITDKITNVADRVIYGAMPGTLGRPVIVTDDDGLILDESTDKYYTLGLVKGAINVVESEEENIINEIVTGKENLVLRTQAEFAVNLGIKGLTWDVGNGGLNPTLAAVKTSTNWDLAATSYKHIAGVAIKSL